MTEAEQKTSRRHKDAIGKDITEANERRKAGQARGEVRSTRPLDDLLDEWLELSK